MTELLENSQFHCCKLRTWCYCSKTPEENIKALREYGYCIGMAFQIVDDILDLTSSSKKIGKPAGNDILQGVITLPVIYAYKHSPNAEELKILLKIVN